MVTSRIGLELNKNGRGMPVATRQLSRRSPSIEWPMAKPRLGEVSGMHLQRIGVLVSLADRLRFPLTKEVMSVGRATERDICLGYSNVSGLHATLQFRDGSWFVRDETSTNGTRVNGKRVTESILCSNDEISFSRHSYKIEYPPRDAGESGASAPSDSSPSPPSEIKGVGSNCVRHTS
jgi:pSer/pThr/pTyr-binding forkhead associated (FHA) protein